MMLENLHKVVPLSDDQELDERQVLDAILRLDFGSYLQKCFNTLAPNTTYQHNWHIDVMVDYLNAAYARQINRLIISIPPRHLKSICTNVAWTSWMLGKQPELKIITASYSKAISIKHALDTKVILGSSWYARVFPEFKVHRAHNTKQKFLTTKHGFRLASSVNASITGEGADYIVIDDPHNPADIFSQKKRQKVVEWLEQVMLSRLNNYKEGVIVIIMQRLHTEDLIGKLLAAETKNHWTYVCLPAIAQKTLYFETPERKICYQKGEALHPKRYDVGVLLALQKEVGFYVFAAQYLQDPVALDCGIIKCSWIKRYASLPKSSSLELIISWDTASGLHAQKSSSSVATIWCRFEQMHYLVEAICLKNNYAAIRKACLQLEKKWNPRYILIENKSSGQQLVQELTPKVSCHVIKINPRRSKIERLMYIVPLFEQGRVFFPVRVDPQICLLEKELLSFPDCEHDDHVDSVTQYLLWSLEQKNYRQYVMIRAL